MNYVIVFVLLAFSALTSGLNLGMMGLRPHDLKRKADLGDSRAKAIYPVREQGNLLLVTLLLCNVGVNAIIAIYLNSLASGLVAGIVSTLLITVFGEIFPQALFSRFALEFGAKVIWLVKIIRFALYPIAAPLAFVLDRVLGDELPTVYSRRELRELILEHGGSDTSEIRADESRIAHGAFTFGEKRVAQVMIPRSSVATLDSEEILDEKTIAGLIEHGYSPIPVVEPHTLNVAGILYAYDLIDPKYRGKPVREVMETKVYYVNENDGLDHVLNAFIQKKYHLFIVVNQFAEFTGIITIEDIIEEILGKEIVDEFDEFEDVRKVAEHNGELKRKAQAL